MIDEFLTFSKESEAELIEKKSRFIAAGCACYAQSEAESFIQARRLAHRGARHTAFAYRIEGLERMSDDGEPQGTAGVPILNLLKGENILNAVIAVTRYFGGTLLGTGGLVRAYGGAAKLCLANSLCLHKRCARARAVVSYHNWGKIQHMMSLVDLAQTEPAYTDQVEFGFIMPYDQAAPFLKRIEDTVNGDILILETTELFHRYPF
ncbi:MAG: YigZ family protein [Clostridiales bacterium]|jgi:uncharacterized YigZ family protein|nr:YigZ family protein [Clostridiales bacterium]MDR2751115.1 YigZ family protein [Clostridiales bacterium]